MRSADLQSAPGSVAQVRESAERLLRVAKRGATAIVLVGHVTKDGTVAGPRVLEHLVDAVLQFEGDRYRHLRVLRAVKNRFGSTDEIGIFEMTDAGLQPGRRPVAPRWPSPSRPGRARCSCPRSRARARSCSRCRRSSRRATWPCRAGRRPASTATGCR